MTSSDEEHLPLQVDVPKEHLPEVLHVYDKHALVLSKYTSLYSHRLSKENETSTVDKFTRAKCSRESFLARCPVKYVRKYPPVPTKDEEAVGDRCTIGQLDLSQGQRLDTGSHSYVFRGPLTLPSRAAVPSSCGEVAVKLARAGWGDHEMLEHEAMIYDKFPCELQQSTPPVVPKFFGFYTPSCDSADSYEDEHDELSVRQDVRVFLEDVSPILLLEPCGEQIERDKVSGSNGDTINGIYDRLHDARFTQGSVYKRNILVQPGPLTLPRAERSLDNPSYRLIDFGRGECFYEDESHETIEKERRDVRSRISRGTL